MPQVILWQQKRGVVRRAQRCDPRTGWLGVSIVKKCLPPRSCNDHQQPMRCVFMHVLLTATFRPSLDKANHEVFSSMVCWSSINSMTLYLNKASMLDGKNFLVEVLSCGFRPKHHRRKSLADFSNPVSIEKICLKTYANKHSSVAYAWNSEVAAQQMLFSNTQWQL